MKNHSNATTNRLGKTTTATVTVTWEKKRRISRVKAFECKHMLTYHHVRLGKLRFRMTENKILQQTHCIIIGRIRMKCAVGNQNNCLAVVSHTPWNECSIKFKSKNILQHNGSSIYAMKNDSFFLHVSVVSTFFYLVGFMFHIQPHN